MPEVTLDSELSSIGRGMLGCKKSVEKKLAAKYGAPLAATMGQVAEAEIGYSAAIHGLSEPLVGRLVIPSAALLLAQDFEWFAKHSPEVVLSDGRQCALIDRHDDESRAWLVRSADGAIAVHVADPGQQQPTRKIAADLDEYLTMGLAHWYAVGWHRALDPQTREALDRSVAALDAIALDRPVTVDVVERVTLDDAGLDAFVAAYIAQSRGLEKEAKARVKAAKKLGPLVRVRLHVQRSPMDFIPNDRVASLLVDAPGGEAFLAACGASDPRFDWLFHHGYANSVAPAEYVGARFLEELDFNGGQTEFTTEIVVAASMVPGLHVGLRYSAVKPYG